jgi:N-acylethanolamine-hydrolysing acid amidase
MANIFYEITGVVNTSFPDLSLSCTSLVAQRSNGTVYIARNQDYPPPFTLLMVHAIFQRANKTVYQGTTYAGTIGLSTAAIFSPGEGFALSIDARDNPHQGTPEGQAAAIAAANRGAAIFPMITRQVCELTNNFTAAVSYLSTKEMIMTGYLIIAGGQPGQGAIVTRNASADSTDVLTLFDAKVKDFGGGDWYVAQTNFDHWKPEPDYPLTNVTRRETATRVLNSIGPDAIDLLGLWNVLDTPPVYNLATIHTDLISVAWAEYKTYKRHGPL